MKKFKLTLCIITVIFNCIQSYSQDFIDDLYETNNNYSSFFNIEEVEQVFEDSLMYDDYDMDYEMRIRKFHNPHYNFIYTWDYGWNSPYWHNWQYPYYGI